MTLKSTLINASFMIAAALPLAAMAEPENFTIPDEVSARADHCGYASEQANKVSEEDFVAVLHKAGKPEMNPDAPNFEMLRRFKDTESPSEVFNSSTLTRPSEPFSRCQALSLAKSLQSTILVFGKYDEEHGRAIMLFDPPQP